MGSQHCHESFTERGFAREKLFCNPYGVDLSQVDLSGTEFRNVLALGVRWPGGVLPNGVVGAWEDLSNPGATHARLDHVYFGRVDLSGSSFLYAHLASASLRFASFRDANFTGAILRLADARNADLRGARFDRADLRGVDFRGASLSGASFVNSIVDSTTRVDPGVELIGSVYSDKMSRIRGQVVSFSFDQRSDCSGFRMSGVHQIGSQFSRVDCDRMDLSVGSCLGCSLESSSVASMDVSFGDVSSSNFGESRALTVDLSGAKAQVVTFADFTMGRLVATNADLTGSSLIGVSILDYGDFRGADLRDCRAIAIIMFDGSFSGANLESCDLRGAMLAGVDFRDSSLREADLRGADLRGADLEGADLEGALFDGFTQWPSDDFDWDSRGAHVDVTRWDLVQPSLMRFARLHGQI